jgi:hypothetical protein
VVVAVPAIVPELMMLPLKLLMLKPSATAAADRVFVAALMTALAEIVPPLLNVPEKVSPVRSKPVASA